MDSVGASRREFILKTGLLAALSATVGMPVAAWAAEETPKAKAPEIEVLPAEDLMREHGVLRRVLLIYGEAVRRIEAREEVPPDGLTAAAWMIRSFVEDYHEKLEEEYLFPRFCKAEVLTDLVEVLSRQHKAGRRVTGLVLELATPGALKDAGNRRRLADALRMFIRMYAPHAAREDTVLFPAMHRLWTPGEYREMGEVFEKRERELFGEDGFEKWVAQVAEIEKQFGIYELAQFTPEIAG